MNKVFIGIFHNKQSGFLMVEVITAEDIHDAQTIIRQKYPGFLDSDWDIKEVDARQKGTVTLHRCLQPRS